LEIQDLVKALYQSEFGCGHLITDSSKGLAWITEESRSCQTLENPPPLVEPLGDSFCRVHLQASAARGLSVKTLFRLFELSAAEPAGSMDVFLNQLAVLESMISSDQLPLHAENSHSFLSAYRRAGCPATHHSESFRRAYHPAYRVIRADFARFLDLFSAIDKLLNNNTPVIIAIEGSSATGKSTLADLLKRVYDCNVFHMDDFFLQTHQRTSERFAQPGGNVDYERFREEVLLPLTTRKPFSYRPFCCANMSLSSPVQVIPKQLSVIEGAYSMHPTLSGFYDFSVFLKIDERLQAERILKRNGEQMYKRFRDEWIPLEKRYFEHFHIENQCNLCQCVF
jgi:uridine kinase